MESDRIISRYKFMESESHTLAPPTISCIFVQLRNFRLKEDECVSDFDRWCYAIKHSAVLQGIPDGFTGGAFGALFDACEIAAFDKDKRLKYDKDMMTELDYRSEMSAARKAGIEEGMARGIAQGVAEGRAEGVAEGRAEGIAASRQEIASHLKAQGVASEIICASTGLSPEEVQAL